MSDPRMDHVDAGWRPNPEGVERFLATLPHAPTLAAAAPDWLDDGQAGDLLPYLAWYEIECRNPDGSVWKPKGEEPPYIPQRGNNCTSEGLGHGVDLLQAMHIAQQQHERPADGMEWVFHRVAVEYTYAAGLLKAGMRGDNGCYGGAIAQGGREIGFCSYRELGPPYEEDARRLQQFANNPQAAVSQYADKAAPYRIGSVVKVTTVREARAALANSCIITAASSVGFNTPRDERGICRARGRWDHQMFWGGSITSDGTPTIVQFQSWGKNMPSGPQPFRLPSFGFRILDADAQRQLDAGDSYAVSLFPGFEKKPLPNRWTNRGWGR